MSYTTKFYEDLFSNTEKRDKYFETLRYLKKFLIESCRAGKRVSLDLDEIGLGHMSRRCLNELNAACADYQFLVNWEPSEHTKGKLQKIYTISFEEWAGCPMAV